MTELAMQLGVGGIFAILLIREFINLVYKMKNKDGNSNGNGHAQICKDTKEIVIDSNDKIKSLHSLHAKYDGDGRPLWYFPRSITESQKRIAEVQEKTAGHLKDVSNAQAQVVDLLKEIKDHVI